LATIFLIFLALLVIDSSDPEKQKLIVLANIATGIVFIGAFYTYELSFGATASLYPLFIIHQKGGYSTMTLDLSQVTALLLIYRSWPYLSRYKGGSRWKKKDPAESVSPQSVAG